MEGALQGLNETHLLHEKEPRAGATRSLLGCLWLLEGGFTLKSINALSINIPPASVKLDNVSDRDLNSHEQPLTSGAPAAGAPPVLFPLWADSASGEMLRVCCSET